MSETIQTTVIDDKVFEKNIISRSVFRISNTTTEKLFFLLVQHFQLVNKDIIDRLKSGDLNIDDVDISSVKNDVLKISYNELFSYQRNQKITESTLNKLFSECISDWVCINGKYTTLFEFIDTKSYKFGVEIQLRNFLLKEYLDIFKEFTVYNVSEVLELQGTYSLRLYHLLKSYEYLDYIILKVDDLKRILNCYTIDDKGNIIADKYKNFHLFKMYVLDTSKRQIEKKTTLRFDYSDYDKVGRKVISLKFIFHSKNYKKLKAN